MFFLASKLLFKKKTYNGVLMKSITFLSLAISLLFVLGRVGGHQELSARSSVKNYIHQQQIKVAKTYRDKRA